MSDYYTYALTLERWGRPRYTRRLVRLPDPDEAPQEEESPVVKAFLIWYRLEMMHRELLSTKEQPRLAQGTRKPMAISLCENAIMCNGKPLYREGDLRSWLDRGNGYGYTFIGYQLTTPEISRLWHSDLYVRCMDTREGVLVLVERR